MVGPLAERLARRGVEPDVVTWTGLVLGVACGAAAWRHWWAAASVLWVVASVCDLVDGPMARSLGRSGGRGARLDTVCDRVVDAAPLVGLAGGGTHTAAALCALVLVWTPAVVGQLGDRRGVAARGGPMGRPQRAVVTLAALAVPPVCALALWVLAVGAALTSVVRLVRLRRRVAAATA